MATGHIQYVPTEQLGVIIAQLVRQGVMFNATPVNELGTLYNIELTGGY